MATSRQDSIALRIGGAPLSPNQFRMLVEGFFAFVKEVAKNQAEENHRMEDKDWLVNVKSGSTVIEMLPSSEYADFAHEKIFPEVSALMKDSVEDAAFNDSVRQKRNAFIEGIHKTEREIEVVIAGEESVDIEKNETESSITRGFYESYGRVEGFLENANTHGNNYFSIFEILSDKKIRCLADREDIIQQVRENFGERIEIYGDITYENDAPKEVRVDRVIPRPDEAVRVRFSELQGILKDDEE